MSKADQLAQAEAELAKLLADRAALNRKIGKVCESRDQLFKIVNEANYTDIAWLIKNPEAAGAHEAIRLWIKNTFGGEYRGVGAMGYLHDGNYRNLQLNFQFQFRTYSEITRDEVKANADLFVSEVLPLLKPMVEVTRDRYRDQGSIMMVPLQFRSEETGLDFLGVDADGTWYHYSQVYGRTEIRRTFESWDAAFDFAWEMSQRDEEDQEEDW